MSSKKCYPVGEIVKQVKADILNAPIDDFLSLRMTKEGWETLFSLEKLEEKIRSLIEEKIKSGWKD